MTSLTHHSQQTETSGRNDKQDVLRHKQTFFSSSWIPVRGSMKKISMPRELWLLYRSLTHLAQVSFLLHRSPLWGARLCIGRRKKVLQCVLVEDILKLPVSLGPTLATLVVVLALQERVAHELASQKDMRCADLPLPSHAITVHSVPTTASTNVDSVVDGNVQVSRLQAHEGLRDGGAWWIRCMVRRDRTGRGHNVCWGSQRRVWSWRVGRDRHDEAQIDNAQHRTKPKISGRLTVVHHEQCCVAEKWTGTLGHKCGLFVHLGGRYPGSGSPLGHTCRVRDSPQKIGKHIKIQHLIMCGRRLLDVAASLQQGVGHPSGLPMIGIVRHKMKWYSRNNLRLWWFKEYIPPPVARTLFLVVLCHCHSARFVYRVRVCTWLKYHAHWSLAQKDSHPHMFHPPSLLFPHGHFWRPLSIVSGPSSGDDLSAISVDAFKPATRHSAQWFGLWLPAQLNHSHRSWAQVRRR